MKFLDCPYCGKEAASILYCLNIIYWFIADKECAFCKKPIRININWLYVFVLPLIVFLIGLIFVALDFVFENYVSEAMKIFFFIIGIPLLFSALFVANLTAISFLCNKLNLNMFIKK